MAGATAAGAATSNDNFEKAFTLLMGSEGRYSNNPHDPGGETMWGVTKRAALRWGYAGRMVDLPRETAKQIAKAEYWNPHNCDALPLALAFQVFDTAYNGGEAVKWLQECLSVGADGNVGPQTIAAAQAADPWRVVALFNAKRLVYLASLKQAVFADGRMVRIANNLTLGELQ